MNGNNRHTPPRRSLLVTHKKRWNGETEYAACLIGAEVELGYRVTLVAPEACELVRRLRDRVNFVPLPGLRPAASPRDFIRDYRLVAGLLQRESYDIVHSSRASAHAITALAVRKRFPFLHVRSGAKKPYGHPANRFLYRSLTDGVVVSSTRIRDWLVGNLGLDPARVHRLLAPVDTDTFSPGEPDPGLFRELNLEPEQPLVLNVARLAPVKGHPVLVEAMAAVLKRFPRAVLVLVGNPWRDQTGLILRQARGLGIGKSVICTGRRDDVQRFIHSAAVCVSSSVGSEENSRAVSEYMAGGKPVVGTRVGVIPELVEDGVTGRLVSPQNSVELGAAIGEILADPGRARRMGEAGRRAAEERFSARVFQRELKSVLDQTIARSLYRSG